MWPKTCKSAVATDGRTSSCTHADKKPDGHNIPLSLWTLSDHLVWRHNLSFNSSLPSHKPSFWKPVSRLQERRHGSELHEQPCRPAAPWLCCPARPGEPPGVRAHPVHVHVHQQVLAGVSGVHTGGGAPRDKKGASMPHPQCQSCAYHHHPWLLSVVNIKRKEIYQSIFFLFTLFSTEISFPYWYKSFLC